MASTAKVSRYIPDIAPNLTLRQDKAHPMYPANRKRYALPKMDVIREIEPNYSWTRLPDLSGYRSAIVRNKVCEGLMYLLPGNKNGASMARPYTADLAAIFRDPYHNFKPTEYNEDNVRQSSSIHFSPNTHITRLSKHRQIRQQPHNLNRESNDKYEDYRALVLRREEGGEKGKDNLPVVVKVGKAEEELQQEVQDILDEVGVNKVLEGQEGGEERPYSSIFNSVKSRHTSATNTEPLKVSETATNTEPLKVSEVGFNTNQQQRVAKTESQQDTPLKLKEFRQHQYIKKSAKFKDFKELRETEVPRPQLPDQLKTDYLSEQKTQDIWNWLHWDFKKSKFEYFIEVCS